MASFYRCLHILLPAMYQTRQSDADQMRHKRCTSTNMWNRLFYGKTVVKFHLTFRVINHELLKLNLYSWYSCTGVVLKNQCLIYYVLLFFDNVFFSYERVILAPKCFYVHFVYIDNVLFCVSSKSLVTPSSIEYSKNIALA